jgi:4-diphosphocytidyl-2-C-methyl-D-erythritol kinase
VRGRYAGIDDGLLRFLSGTEPSSTVAAFAAAKINLYLHVTGRRPDGYHFVDSLVAFADIGDRLWVKRARSLSLAISGPGATELEAAGEDNLVLRAARLLARHAGIEPGAAIRLEKNLPVAAGLGGGSSDAAAALKALAALWRVSIGAAELRRLGLALGADLPVCLYAGPAWVGGIGEEIEPAADLPAAGIVLAHPRRRLPTAAVFAAWRGRFAAPARFSPTPPDAAGLARALAARGNNLTEAAIGLVPEIAAALAALAGLDGALLARMSGSGASCFALFSNRAAADAAGGRLARAHPEWWCAAGSLLPAAGVFAGQQVRGTAFAAPRAGTSYSRDRAE